MKSIFFLRKESINYSITGSRYAFRSAGGILFLYDLIGMFFPLSDLHEVNT